jgi:hypothetical protein
MMATSGIESWAGAAAAVVLLWIFPLSRSSHHSTAQAVDERPLVVSVGGAIWFAKWWPINATWPFVRLELYSWGVRIGPNYGLKILPTTDLQWSDILSVRQRATSIRFRRSDRPGYWVSFGPKVDPRLIAALHQNGVDFNK